MTVISDLLTRWDASITSMRALADAVAGGVTPPPPPPPSSATLNPADKNAAIILSNNNLTATRATGDGWAVVRGTVGKNAGKWGFEFTQGVRSGNGMVGLANAAAPLDNHSGFDNNGVGYSYADGQLYVNSQPVNAGPGAYSMGDVMSVEVDFDAVPKTIAFSLNGGSYSAAHPLGTGAGPYFPAISIHGGSGSGSINFGGSAFQHALRAGVSAWN